MINRENPVSGNAASIRQRLLNLARERNENFDFVLKQYVIQRLLYRLSVSKYYDQYLLKGAMLFLVWTGDLHRPTKDIDLLGFGSNDIAVLENQFKDIFHLDINDGLLFDKDSINGAQIKENELYQGVRLTGFAYLGKAKVSFQVDIGFGDAVTPEAEQAIIPSFLDLPNPEMKIYPVYTVIAEKFQAMVALGIANSRLKDFYDIWVIATNMELDGELLLDAVNATFTRRETALVADTLTIFGDVFKNDESKQIQWIAFLNKNGLQSDHSFFELMDLLQILLEPVYQAIVLKRDFAKRWDRADWKWIEL